MGEVKEEVRIRVVVKPVDRITWNVQIGGLLDLNHWRETDAVQCGGMGSGGMDEEKIEEMPVDINSKCPSIVSWNWRPQAPRDTYLSDAFDGLAPTPPASIALALPLPLVPTPRPTLALRIDKSTSLQYLSLSSRRCANFACSESVDGGRSALAMTWLSVQRVST
jgi:hypothetical protein